MKKFLVLYQASQTAAEQMANVDPEMRKKGMKLWMDWREKNKEAIVDFGSPTGNAMTVMSDGSSEKSMSTAMFGGFSIFQADSIDAIMEMLKDHPHFHTPGASIEVLEFLPMSGM